MECKIAFPGLKGADKNAAPAWPKSGNKGVSFDLSALSKLTEGGDTTAFDRVQTGQSDYLYTFGICHSVAPPANCLKADGTPQVKVATAPGWQTKRSESWATMPAGKLPSCKYLGNPDFGTTSNPINRQWSLYDPTDPGRGVSLTYTGGQHCSNGQQRALQINFLCSKREIEKIDQVFDESEHCKYEITLESQYACPLECGFGSSGSMCGGHGICRYDTDADRARCFCNSGHSGAGCSDGAPDEEGQSYGPVLGLLIFVTIVMVALVGGIYMLWRFMSTRMMAGHQEEIYNRMRNEFGGDGLMENATASATRNDLQEEGFPLGDDPMARPRDGAF